jgi:hypothetical protein
VLLWTRQEITDAWVSIPSGIPFLHWALLAAASAKKANKLDGRIDNRMIDVIRYRAAEGFRVDEDSAWARSLAG